MFLKPMLNYVDIKPECIRHSDKKYLLFELSSNFNIIN